MAQDDKQTLDRQTLLEGIPSLNLGALLMPPIWGPAHGIWITILYYPVLLFADNLIYSAYENPQPLSIVLSIVTIAILVGVTVVFARASQGYAYQRSLERGMTKEAYLKRQRIWAIVSAIILVVMVCAATYYNLCIRPTLGA